MTSDAVRLTLFWVNGTKKAHLFSTADKGVSGSKQSWVPKKLCWNCRWHPEVAGHWRKVEATLPSGFANKKRLTGF
jgi:hypothetical protein